MSVHYGCIVQGGYHVAARLDDYARSPVAVGEARKTPRAAIHDVKRLRRIEAQPKQITVWEGES